MKILKLGITTIVGISLLISCNKKVEEDISPLISETDTDTWKFHAGEGKDSLWMNTDYDDSSWQEVKSSQLLKDQNVSLENGFGRYRKTIRLSDSLQQAAKNKGALILHLGKLAATDEVYLNGKLIGKTGQFPHDYMGYFDNERNYLAYEKDLNLKGDNLIAIKFHDGWSSAGGFLSDAAFTISSAETNDKIDLDVAVADSDYIFMDTNPIKITVNLMNNNKWDVDGILHVTFTTDDYQPISSDSIVVKINGGKSFSKEFTHDNPAPEFYRYTVQLKRNGTTAREKKFNVGYEPEKIVSPTDSKDDLKQFWDNSLKELAKVSPDYKFTLIPEASQIDYDMYLVEMRSFGNELIQGYYAKPKKEGTHPVIIEYMGYGSSPYYPNQWWDGFAYFVLSIRGQALNQPTNRFGTWITYGLENKNDYYYRGAFLDAVRAIDFVCSRAEIDKDKIAVRGGSQGGALSFAAAALDKRVKAAAPNIPFLSDYPDYFKITHWPRSDFETYMKDNPEAKWEDVYGMLTYFDIKNLAPWIECPLIMGIGVQDDVCPPHINFAAYNQVKSKKRWMAFAEYGHSVGREYNEAAMAFIKENLNVK